MKITLKKTIAKLLCLATCVSSIAMPLVACGTTDNGDGKNPGNKPTNNDTLILATDALDTLFNPYFYTSGPDGEIVSQTQIGMLSSDENGELVANWNEPCVSLAWSYVKHGDKSMVQGNNYGGYYTDYYFAIKDNILFSDGVPLTTDDILFNMYMYLDPAYTGSNTMYSVNIQGLTEYRTQTLDLDNAAAADANFNIQVDGRMSSVLAWSEDRKAVWGDDGFAQYEYYTDDKTLESDINKIQEYYETALRETWTSAISADVKKEYEKYKDKDGNLIIDEPWKLFLFSATNSFNLRAIPGQDGKTAYYEYDNAYVGKIPATEDERKGESFREDLIKYAYNEKFYEQKEATKSYKDSLRSVLLSYPVNSYMNDYWLSDVKHRMFKDNMQVKNIRGIEILKNQSYIEYMENENDADTKRLELKDAEGNAKSYDVLHIRINGVDPKAKQNFAFTVAPGHYYSTTEAWKLATEDDGKDNEHFGVVFSDPDFMSSVRAKQLPLGAGPYRASTVDGGAATEKSQFFGSSNLAYFEANEKFLLGAPKIKKLRYKVISNTQLYNAVKTGEVHYASPSMKSEDINALENNDNKTLSSAYANNLGYGYIGVSARYIPNIYIRKAIMTTFNVETHIEAYYGQGGSVIYRPMSKTLTDYYNTGWKPYYEFDITGASAKALMEKGGCKFDNGVMKDEKGKPIKYTFTIAGDSDDHPANNMLLQSARILNDIGCDITVVHDSVALSKLSSGLLTVWAAAWSSSSDPDMYQVYHKDSQATSTTAWGYKYIFSSEFSELEPKNNPDNYQQREMIQKLSDRIDDGRETDVVADRRDIYCADNKDSAMNILMDLAVEFPTYQRRVYYIWRKGVFKEETLKRGAEVTSYQSPLSRIWEVELA
ncbi:MAG: hypothetical protein K2O04_02200 [Clostridiales bacterium]|nr:hypothetical protein [Clostridiales bacterium]